MEYGIGVRNKYDIFGLDVDDPDFIHVSLKKQGAQKPTTNDVKKPLQKANTNTDKVKTITYRTSEKTAVTTNNINFKNGDKKENKRTSSNFKDAKDSGRTERIEARSRFERRDTKFTVNKDRKKPFAKREFDRKSGSDKASVKPTEKRVGLGKSNWGNFNEDENVQNESAENVEETENHQEANDTNDANETNDEIENAESIEKETKFFTLDEWRKHEKEKRLVPKYNIRKPGEGDTQQWKKGYVLKKKEEEEEEVIVYEEIEVEDIKQGKQKKILDIDITFREDRNNAFGFRGGNRLGGNRLDRPRTERRPPRDDRLRENRAPRDNRPPRTRPSRDIKSDREDRGNRENRVNHREEKKEGEDRKGGFVERDEKKIGVQSERDDKKGGVFGERDERKPPIHGDRDDKRDIKDRKGGHIDERRGFRKENEERRVPRPDGVQRRSGGNLYRGKGNKQAAPKFDDLIDFPNLASNKVES